MTLIVFWLLLAWFIKPSYFNSIPNLTLHTLVPILVVMEYLFFTKDYKTTRLGLSISLIFPFSYFIFSVILIAIGVSFGPDMQAPYFFVDYKENGWFKFSNGQIGVVYWVILILIIFYLISSGIDKVHKVILKKGLVEKKYD